MHPDIKDSWTLSRNETQFLLLTFRRVIFRLCSLSSKGEATSAMHGYWATLVSPTFLISDYSFWSAVGLFLHSLTGLMRCSVCPVKPFSPCGSLYFLLFFFIPSPFWTNAPHPFFLFPRLVLGSFDDVHYCFSNTHRLACHSFSAQTDCKRCHILCCELVPDDSSTPNVFF